MSEKTMLLQKKHIHYFATAIDNAIEAKGLIELLDYPAASITLNIVNAIVSPKMPPDLKEAMSVILDEIIEKDYIEAAEKLADFLNTLIDVPYIDEETEGVLLKSILTYVASMIKIGQKID
jgi:hypothetical protein